MIHTKHVQAAAAGNAVAAHWRQGSAAVGVVLTSLLFAAQVPAAESSQAHQSTLGAPVNLYAPNADLYATSQNAQVYALHAHGQVWLLAGEPGESNVAVQMGDEGVVVVDTGTQSAAPQLLEQIQK